MKRICSYCRKDIGEKCGKCGSVFVQVLAKTPAGNVELWGCRACGRSWHKDSEGVTDGICDACYENLHPLKLDDPRVMEQDIINGMPDATGEP